MAKKTSSVRCEAVIADFRYGHPHRLQCARHTAHESRLCFQHRRSDAEILDEEAKANGWERRGHYHHRNCRYERDGVEVTLQFSADRPSRINGAEDSTGWKINSKNRDKLVDVRNRFRR